MGSFLETYNDSGFLGGFHSFPALFDYSDLRSSTHYSLTVCLRGNFPTSRQRNDVFSKS